MTCMPCCSLGLQACGKVKPIMNSKKSTVANKKEIGTGARRLRA